MSNLNAKFAATTAELQAQMAAARSRNSAAAPQATQQLTPTAQQPVRQPQSANIGTAATRPAFDINNPGAYGKLLGQGFSTAGMYDVEAPEAKAFMQSSGFNNAQYGALRSAAQRARSNVLAGARSGNFSAINPANILTPEEQATLTPQVNVNVPGLGEVDANQPIQLPIPGFGGFRDFLGVPKTVNTGITPAGVSSYFGSGVDQDAIKNQITEAAQGEVMNRDNPFVRNLLAQASVPYMEGRFKDWFGDETALGRGAQSIGNLIMGLLSKIPGYETIVNKGIDWFNPELLTNMGIKTSAAKLPPYFHYALVGKFAGNDILQKVTKELS